MHGELLKARCAHCNLVAEWCDDLSVELPCPDCRRTGGMRPHVVWLEEMPMYMERFSRRWSTPTCSCRSAPRARSIRPPDSCRPKSAGIRTCEINLDPSENAYVFDERRYGPATELVPDWVDEVLSGDLTVVRRKA
jgi:NAD-dependent protein deacetylase/lipoamidase